MGNLGLKLYFKPNSYLKELKTVGWVLKHEEKNELGLNIKAIILSISSWVSSIIILI